MGWSINLVNDFKVEKVIFNCGPYNDLAKELIKVLDKKKIRYYSCIKELNIDNNKLYFLQTKEYDNENDNSNVIYTELNGYKFMFMGDASITTEKEILSKYNLSDVDVLKVGHHGSRTSSSIEFINEINPKYSIIGIRFIDKEIISMYIICRRNVIMIRIFKPKSLYPRDDKNEVKIDELNLDSPEFYLNYCETKDVGRYLYRTQENGGSEADWQWLGIKNPYPDDEIMSQAAFMFYMNNAVNSQYGGAGLIVCSDENNFAYCIDKKMSKELEGLLERSQEDIKQRIRRYMKING